ncbi:hypothetical protein [Noviherbaspirillum cavernae]|uniref:hypothetical protein n=1 Tax=Noviherbaspirillum cavernae TaxID=2320862 RepID=UPI001313FE0B|nr:hypothetical protein [Noviherbaspirillum cavernae]
MKWYYRLKLRKMLAEIETLKRSTESPLTDSYYTDHARLRMLNVLAAQLEQRLAS